MPPKSTLGRPFGRSMAATLNNNAMDTMPLFAAGAAAFFAICYILTLLTSK